MNIEHKTTPIEHWIVDGKAYRLATEADVGKDCYFADAMLTRMRSGMLGCLHGTLTRFNQDSSDKYWSGGTCWLFALIQDDSLLATQRTPVPALGDGWYLLRDDEVLEEGDRVNTCGVDAHAATWVNTMCRTQTVKAWRRGNADFCCARYFGPVKEPEPAVKPIDWTKPVRTKDGRAVRVLCTDGPNTMYPVIGVVCGSAATYTWSIDGKYCTNGTNAEINLENVPTRIQREYWVCVYPEDTGLLWQSREEALRMSKDADPIAIVKITIDCEEGEGL